MVVLILLLLLNAAYIAALPSPTNSGRRDRSLAPLREKALALEPSLPAFFPLMNDILSLSATAQGRLIREGAISSAELVEAHLARIDEVNPRLNAVVEVLRESARAAARASDRRRAQGALLSRSQDDGQLAVAR